MSIPFCEPSIEVLPAHFMRCRLCRLANLWKRTSAFISTKMEDIMKMDIYKLFEVEIGADEKEIKSAYRKKALTCHPDKNPGNPDAAALFHQLSKALEILIDPEARASYDKVLKAKKAAQLRHRKLDNEAKKFKEDLEAKEKAAQEEFDRLDAESKLEKEIERLRKEGSKLVEEEKERMRREIIAERESASTSEAGKMTAPTLKVSWKAGKKDPENGGYTEELVRAALEKHGEVTCLIMSKKKTGSALVEFGSTKAALSAMDSVLGNPENPLQLTWVSGQPRTETFVIRPGSAPDGSDAVTRTKYSDFESVVMSNMRRAAERQRLIKNMILVEQSEMKKRANLENEMTNQTVDANLQTDK